MGTIDELGVRRVINCLGSWTILGGSVLSKEVLDAMADAARSYVVIDELEEKAGNYMAKVTGAEAAYVTSGSAAALVLATAACITGKDPAKIHRLPNTEGLKNEVVIQRGHRNVYDHAFRVPGAKLVEIGIASRTAPWELEAAINEKTAAIAYVLSFTCAQRGMLTLEQVVETAKKHKVPVIVDAAAEIPPVENLRKFIEAGADLVAFSGGKGLRGPNNTGILCGRRDLVEAAKLQAYPHDGVGRPMKVGKECIAGLVKALQMYVEKVSKEEQQIWESRVKYIVENLNDIPGLEPNRVFPDEPGHPIPSACLCLDGEKLGKTAAQVIEALWSGDPAIRVWDLDADRGVVKIVPTTMQDGDEKVVVDRIKEILNMR